ncbi:uncharacterized protein LOC134063814 isoform X2 [Sardina pilchardus]|uniref:uncharacterized protein LOC134063814 isoform X2 n=1 Tax=Sardina pilchardus TaxID=27697 RepID=UPI002E0F5B7B
MENDKPKHRPRSQAQRKRRHNLSQWGQVQKRMKRATPDQRGPEYLKAFFNDDMVTKLIEHHSSYKQHFLEHGAAEQGAEGVYVDPSVDIHFLRATIGTITKKYLKEQKKSHRYLPENRPAWWPLAIPFSSPNNGKNQERKDLDVQALLAIAVSYNEFHGFKRPDDTENEQVAGTSSSQQEN